MMSKSSGAMPRAYEATAPLVSNPRAHPVTFTANIYQQTDPDKNQNDRGRLRRHDPLSKPELKAVEAGGSKGVEGASCVTKRAGCCGPQVVTRLNHRLEIVGRSGSQGESGWKEKVGNAPSKTIRHGHRRGRAQHRSGNGIRQEVHVNRRT